MRVNENLAIVGSLQFGLSGPWDCHVYALRGPGGIVLIDAGSGTATEQILQNTSTDLSEDKVVALLITHCHFDHCGGAASLRLKTGCSVRAPKVSRMTLEEGDEQAVGLRLARDQGLYPPDTFFQSCPVDAAVSDGEHFTAAGLDFTAIQVRGHSCDMHCYLVHVENRTWLFAGDAVFYGGVLGVINAEGSGMGGYRADLPKLAGLDVQGLFPGHGLFTLKDGQRHLDCAIQQSRKGFLGHQIGQGDLLF
jgi:hydroxyacylglutathione hydrolase